LCLIEGQGLGYELECSQCGNVIPPRFTALLQVEEHLSSQYQYQQLVIGQACCGIESMGWIGFTPDGKYGTLLHPIAPKRNNYWIERYLSDRVATPKSFLSMIPIPPCTTCECGALCNCRVHDMVWGTYFDSKCGRYFKRLMRVG